MTYIYDIYLNFKSIPYEFYDWNKNDDIIHIKKTPLFIIDNNDFKRIMNSNIKLDDKTFKCIENKTSLYNDNRNILSCALFTDRNNIISIMFDDNGFDIKRSFLVIDEELDILGNLDDLDQTFIEYNTLKKIKYYINTRNQIKMKEFINEELKKCEQDRLKYIYFECFNEYEKDINKIMKKMKKLKNDNNTYKNLYYALKITSSKK